MLNKGFKAYILGILVFGGFFSSQFCFGFNIDTNSFLSIEPLDISYVPRVYIEGLAGSAWVGNVDIISPVWLKDDRAAFLYAQGRYAEKDESWQKNTWLGSVGLGYRQILGNRTYGGYFLADYNSSPSGHKFWVMSPGLESLGEFVDFRLNAYFPSENEWVDEAWADEFGDYQWVELRGHEQYDHLYRYYENAGSGLDFEVGVNFTKRIQTSVNAYHFSIPNHDNINGGGIRVNFKVNSRLGLKLTDSYDNYQHNVFLAGIQLTLGGRHSEPAQMYNDEEVQNYLGDLAEPGDLQDAAETSISVPIGVHNRLLDKIERSYGSTKSGSSVPTIPGYFQDIGRGLERNNLWYFDANKATDGDGTYENPYRNIQFNQTTIDFIDNYKITYAFPQTYMYFRPGTYNLFGGSAIIRTDQLMYGRIYDYTRPASGDERALFLGSFNLSGNNVLNSIRLQNPTASYVGSFGIGVLDGAGNISFDNVTIGTPAESNSGNFASGVIMDNAGHISINNSQIYAYIEGSGAIVSRGVSANHVTQLDLTNSTVQAIAKETSSSAINNSGNAYGILIGHDQYNVAQDNPIANNVLNISSSNVIGKGYHVNSSGDNSGNGYGILIGYGYAYDNSSSDLSVNNNILKISASNLVGTGNVLGSSYSGNGYGVLVGYNYAYGANTANLSNYANSIEVIQSSTLTGIGAGAGNGYGLMEGAGYAEGHDTANLSINNNGNILISASTLNGSASGSLAHADAANGYGMAVGFGHSYGLGSANLSINNNFVNIFQGTLNGSGSIPGGTNSGNGYGLLIGSGYARNTDNANSSIYANSLYVQEHSNLSGIGINTGNAYGLLFGYGYAETNIASQLSIYNNTDILILNSSLSGNASGSGANGSNGYGLLIGANQVMANGQTNSSIHNNSNILVQNSTLTGNGNSTSGDYSGNGYGMALGYGYAKSATDVLADLSIYQNTIDIVHGTLQDLGHHIGAGNESGNSYGLLVGYGYGEGSGTTIANTLSIHNNLINVESGSSLIESGKPANGTGDASNNGYGLLFGFGYANVSNFAYLRMNDNLLFTSGSTIESDISSSSGNNSGNGYGLLFGFGLADAKNNTDLSIYNNKISISGGLNTGKGNASSGNFSGNGYGMIVGYGYAKSDTNANSQLAIYQNAVTLSQSNLQDLGHHTGTGNYAGNSYGLMVGYGYAQGSGTTNANKLSVYGNTISVSNSSLIEKTKPSTGTGDYSNNGYGLLLGFGYGNATNFADLSVHDNTLTLSTDAISGIGNTSTGNYSGNGYGVLIGGGDIEASDNANASVYNSAVHNIQISGSTITGSGTSLGSNYSGNGAGLILGYNYAHGGGSANLSIHNINTITLNGNPGINGNGSAVGDWSGNGYGMILGDGFAKSDLSSLVDFSIYQNGLTVSATTFNDLGHHTGTGNYAGNSYGLLFGFGYGSGIGTAANTFSIHDNTLSISGSTIKELSTKPTNGTGNYSNNGYGLLLGFGYGYGSNAAEMSIHDNNVTLSTNTITGIGKTMSGNYSGNGYGVVIGYGYALADSTSDLSTHDNNLIFSGSTSNAIANSSGATDSGNAYGALFGYGYGSSSPSGSDISLYNNIISVSSSTLQYLANNSGTGQNSGNGYGLLIGYGYGLGTDNNVSTKASIYGNIIGVSNSTLKQFADKSATGTGDHSNNGYGFLLGSGFGYGWKSANLSVHDNNLTISTNTIEGKGNTISGIDSGNGYGFLVGYGDGFDFDGTINLSVYQNTLTLSNNPSILGNGNSGSSNYSGNGYGLLIGFGRFHYSTTSIGSSDLSIHDNVISSTNDVIKGEVTAGINTGNNSGNGYGVLVGFGAADAKDTANFSVHDNSSSFSGGKIDGIGKSGGMTSGGNYSGNGYGILNGFVYINQTSATAVNKNIYNNNLTISSTTLNGSGTATVSNLGNGDDIANGYGILMGYAWLEQPLASSTLIFSNTINISATSTLTGTSNLLASSSSLYNSGNSFGTLIGINRITTGIHPFTNILSNTLTISNSNITSSANAGGIGNTWNNTSGNAYGSAIDVIDTLGNPFLNISNAVNLTSASHHVTSSGSPFISYGIDIAKNSFSASGNKLKSTTTSPVTIDANAGTAYGVFMNGLTVGGDFDWSTVDADITGGTTGLGSKLYVNGVQILAW